MFTDHRTKHRATDTVSSSDTGECNATAVLPRCGRQKPLRQRQKNPQIPPNMKKSPKNQK
ncbi:unnamed protein product, partial [Nesidiocoris tenuis]